MKIGIVGNGFVGKATKLLEGNNIDVIVYDINPTLCEPPNLSFEELTTCDLIFICVPTPMEKSGKCHTTIVENVVKKLQNSFQSMNKNYETNIIVRSTVPPSTCDRLRVGFMPEFLTEKNWKNDFYNTSDWIFGYYDVNVNDNNNNNNDDNNNDNSNYKKYKNKIEKLFTIAYNNGSIKSKSLHFTGNSIAEMVKYTRNSFLAVKVSYFNEIENYCKKNNISYKDVRNLTILDSRIGESHTDVPGHDGKKGYGGTCLPKDINALLYEFNECNIESYMLSASKIRNEKVDRIEKEWSNNKGRSVV